MKEQRNKMRILNSILLFLLITTFNVHAQDSVNIIKKPKVLVKKTFFAPRIINSSTTENIDQGQLNLLILHRMGRINSGAEQLFGLYQANSQFNFEYGVNKDLMIGLGSTTIDKIFLGFIKYKFISQSSGYKSFPLSIAGYSQIEMKSGNLNYPNNQYYFSSRLRYVFQLNISRKFSEKISLQLHPFIVHRNIVETTKDHNTVIGAGTAFRYKISRKVAIIGEGAYVFPKQIISKVNNRPIKPAISCGLDIFTGKHDIQVFVSNSIAMNESSVFTQTTEQWQNGEIHFGFNIGRLFRIKPSK